MEIHILDTDLVKVGILETFDSFIWTEKFDEFGDFELRTIPRSDITAMLQIDRILTLPGTPKGMFIESVEFKADPKLGDEFIIKGRSLESILDRRTSRNQTIVDGNMQDAMFNTTDGLIYRNVVNSYYSKRNISNFVTVTSSDPIITAITLEAQYRYEPLYEEIVTPICKDNGIGFRIEINDSNEFEFEFTAGTDRSRDQSDNPLVLFSQKMGNLVKSSYFRSMRYAKNDTIVLGQLAPEEEKWAPGTLVIPTYPDDLAGLGKREMNSDGSHIDRYDHSTSLLISSYDYNAMQEKVGEKDLLKNKEIIIFEGTADTTVGPQYREDFFLGDTVEFQDKFGNSGKALIKEVTISYDQTGYSVFPMLEQTE